MSINLGVNGIQLGVSGSSRNLRFQEPPNAHLIRSSGKEGAVLKHRAIPTLTPEVEERFWAKVNVPFQPSGCWEWTACVHPNGYGKFAIKREAFWAHRVSYTTLIGPIPDGRELDHMCRNRSCVNPDHLRAVTQQVNQACGYSPITINKRKVLCSRGHDDWIVVKDGTRVCTICRRENRRKRDARKRLEGWVEPPPTSITPLQIQIVQLIADGLPMADISARLNLSPNSTEYQVERAYRFLGVNAAIPAVREALRRGLVDFS